MKTINTDDLLACAVEAARTAGAHAMANESRRREVAQTFKHDVKLLLDSECQVKAEEVIRLKAERVSHSEIARKLGIGRTSVRRILAAG